MSHFEQRQSGLYVPPKELLRPGEYIDLTVGYMKPEMPEEISEAAAWAELKTDKLGPADKAGLWLYRQAAALDYENRYGLQVDPLKQIYIAAGTTGVLSTMFSYFNAEENQLWEPDIGYVYKEIAEHVGLRNVSSYPLKNGVPDPKGVREMLDNDIKENRQGQIVLVVNFPSNPTGKIASEKTLEELAYQIKESGRKDVFIVEDNVYCRCVFDRLHASIALFYEDTLIADAPSKRGANLQNGFGIVPKNMFKEMSRIRNDMEAVPLPRQYAAAVFLGGGYEAYIEAKRTEMKGNRNVMGVGLRAIRDIEFEDPEGGPYYYFKQNCARSEIFVAWAKRKHEVLLNDGGKYVSSDDPNDCWTARASFAASTPEEIREGTHRIRRAVEDFDPEEAFRMWEIEMSESQS